jgi:hypothetical protein
MTRIVCLGASALGYPRGGGHLWVYLNWALGLRDAGCRVIWLEAVWPNATAEELRDRLAELRVRLDAYGLGDIALAEVPEHLKATRAQLDWISSVDAAAEADLLVNLQDRLTQTEVDRFRRSASLDIDPGLRQLWIDQRKHVPADHDLFFTIGETVGTPAARFPDAGRAWHYTPPAIHLPSWPVASAGSGAAYTTVAHWWGGPEWIDGEEIDNDKRLGFVPYVDLPERASPRLELALGIGGGLDEAARDWVSHGWALADAWKVAGTPWDYQAYIRGSRGEFSCVKPSCVLLQNAWVSDRTLCYLASGKPAVIEHTGPSRFLPDADGMLRFRTPDEAVACLEEAEANYEHHCRAARALAEEYFDATKVAWALLERALA